MRTITHDDIYNHIYTETYLHQFWYDTAQILTLLNIRGTSTLTSILIWHRSDFNPLKYSRNVNSHPERKTVFTQTLRLQERKFKLNPCNAFAAEARTTSLTFVRECLWPLGLSPSSCLIIRCCIVWSLIICRIRDKEEGHYKHQDNWMWKATTDDGRGYHIFSKFAWGQFG